MLERITATRKNGIATIIVDIRFSIAYLNQGTSSGEIILFAIQYSENRSTQIQFTSPIGYI